MWYSYNLIILQVSMYCPIFLKLHVPLLRVAKKGTNSLSSSGALLFININLLEELQCDNALTIF